VQAGHPSPPDPDEPEHAAQAVAKMGLDYVVLTMVDRDDLPDGGASHMARAVGALRELRSGLLVEALVGDFGGNEAAIDAVVDAAPDVFAHNIEVVRRLTPLVRDARCGYERSLEVLARAHARAPDRLTKSSLMVGIGETDDEVSEALSDLRSAGVSIVTVGQYLRPSARHAAVSRYVPPEIFEAYRHTAEALGFAYAASGPLVRSSYRAAEVFMRATASRR
jgi:lipoic acid synthetase